MKCANEAQCGPAAMITAEAVERLRLIRESAARVLAVTRRSDESNWQQIDRDIKAYDAIIAALGDA